MFQILVNEKVDYQEKIENNKKEWNRINNLWLEVKNTNKLNHPELYDTESDKSDKSDNIYTPENNTTDGKILKRCGSSYDELLSSQDCIIFEKNEIKSSTPIMHDKVEDSNTHFTSSSSSLSQYSINDFDIYIEAYNNYNMKTLTHIANYYNIIKKEKKKKMLKQELIYNIVLFETDEKNYPIVYKYREMIQKIEDLKNDKYFSSFILFP
jgi:hypothetical protein